MIVDELTIRQIKSAKVRRRTLELPLERGVLSDGSTYLRRCPMRKDGVYRLVPCGRLEHKRRQARATTVSQAQAVLRFIDLVDGSVRTEKQLEVIVTVVGEPRIMSGLDPAVWHIPIAVGDLSGQIDRDVFLAGDGGYTLSASRQAVPGDPAVMFPAAKDVERARRMAREQRADPVVKTVQAMRQDIDTCKGVMLTMKQEKRRKAIERELAKLHEELLSV